MRRIVGVICVSVLLAGCSISVNTREATRFIVSSTGEDGSVRSFSDFTYEERIEILEPLTIGVVGEIPEYDNTIIDFVQVDPDALRDQQYDGYFVTDDYFEELASAEWQPVITSLTVPTFFINSNSPIQAFTDASVAYSTNFEPTGHSIGLVFGEKEELEWSIGEPAASSDVNDTPPIVLDLILERIVEYQKG
ncbi:hypothetical protein FLK61_24295 [Paenalkalicoccus suaedae]|uniref:Uncharacterized protein n=1 Tax=Paenalkalicoccus suaedae TaxID=2592382 RepID=A0A859FCB2_9BACI|nr:hypothetical protein [Paenalkalicoccus suaedae]QKS69905.1 hypothetical protein FLK61_24295 [Paenalkalicoccus suaedae]